MAKALADEGYAEKVTVRSRQEGGMGKELSTVTVSGYSLFEIATGRRPPDLLDVETCTPEQLTGNPSDEDRTTLDLQRIAMRAHQEARQCEGPRHRGGHAQSRCRYHFGTYRASRPRFDYTSYSHPHTNPAEPALKTNLGRSQVPRYCYYSLAGMHLQNVVCSSSRNL